MKLHLPTRLRAAVLACITAVAALSGTVGTGTITTGVVAYTIAASQAAAAYHGDTHTFDGSDNANFGANLPSDPTDIVFNMDDVGTSNWSNGFNYAGNVLIGASGVTDKGLCLNNGNRDQTLTLSGAVTGTGLISKKGAGQNNTLALTGDVTAFTGNYVLDSTVAFTLRFGSGSAAPATTAEAGVGGTGSITFKTGNNTLAYNYGSGSTVHVTNAIVREGAVTSKVSFAGGANYAVHKDADISALTLTDTASVTFSGTTVLGAVSGATGTSITNAGALTLNGTIDVAAAIVNNGSVTLGDNFKIDLTHLTATEGVYTVFSGTAVDLSALTTEKLLGTQAGYNYTFGADGTVTATATCQNLTWVGGPLTWQVGSTIGGGTFADGDIVNFTTAKAEVTLGGDVTSSLVNVASGVEVVLNGAHTLTAAEMNINGTLVMDDAVLNAETLKLAGELELHSADNLASGTLIRNEGNAAKVTISGTELTATNLFNNADNSYKYSGKIVVADGATLKMGSATSLGNINNTITVEKGGVLDINGKPDHDYTFTLAGGSLVNNGNGVGTGSRQIKGLNVTADSVIGGTGQFGVIGSGYAATTVNLNGHTLTKTGSNTVNMVNTTVTIGTLRVEGGILQQHNSSRINCDIIVAGGNFTGDGCSMEGNHTLASEGAGGTIGCNITSTGVITVDTAADSTLTMSGALTTAAFSKTGAGTLAMSGALSVSKQLSMNYEGALTLGDVSVADGAVLSYGAASADSVIGLAASALAGNVTVDIFSLTAEQLAAGINLGIASDFDVSKLTVGGLSEGDYTIETKNDTLWLKATKAAEADWDKNWGGVALSTAPATLEPLTITETDNFLATNYAESSVIGVQLTASESANNVFGGILNTGVTQPATTAKNVWIDVTGGTYGIIAGGNNCISWQGSSVQNFEGDTHIQLKGGSVGNIIGGNFKDGFGPGFKGSSYISVMEGCNVTGNIIGGNTSAHSQTTSFTGDSHIFVYTMLSSNSSGLESLGNAWIIGGSAWIANAAGGTQNFSGNTNVTIDLSGYTGGAATFVKTVVGGNSTAATSSTVQNLNGSSHVTIKGTDDVTFSGWMIAGARSSTVGTNTQTGNAEMVIDGGHYTGNVVGGFYQNGNATTTLSGTAALTIKGGTFSNDVRGGSQVGGGTATLGGVELTIEGGSFAKDVIAGMYNNVSNTHQVTVGDTAVTMSDGAVTGNLVGGSRLLSGDGLMTNGNVSVAISGGSVAANLIGGDHISGAGDASLNAGIGDIAVTVSGGSVKDIYGGTHSERNYAAGTIAQGNVSVSLTGGTVTGDVYVGGYQGGSTKLTSESTTLEIGSGVTLTTGKTLSGGYKPYDASFNLTATVTGSRTLKLTTDGTQDLSGVIVKDFDTVNVADAAGVVTIASITQSKGTNAITKTGAGTLTLGAGFTADSVTVSEGTLDITSVTSLGGSLTLGNGGALQTTTAEAATAVTGLTVNSGAIIAITGAAEGYTSPIKLLSGLTEATISGLTFTEEEGSKYADISGIITVSGISSDYDRLQLSDGTLSLISSAAPVDELSWLGDGGTWGGDEAEWSKEGSSDPVPYTAGAIVTIGGEGAPGGTITVSGAQTAKSVTIASDDYVLNAASGASLAISGNLTVNEDVSTTMGFLPTLGESSQIVVNEGATLDMTTAGAPNASMLGTLMNKGTGAGTIVVADGGGMIVSPADGYTLNTNLKVNGGLWLNGPANSARTITVTENGSLTLTGKVALNSGTELKVTGGSVTANEIALGHSEVQGYKGSLLMTSGSVTTGSFIFTRTDTANTITIEGGTLTVTGNADKNAFTVGAGDSSVVSISNATLTNGEKDLAFNHGSTLTDATVTATEDTTITVGGTGMTTTLAGTITTQGNVTINGTLVTTDLTGVTNSGDLTINAESVTLAGLNNTGSVTSTGNVELTDATTTGGELSAADVTLTGANTFGKLTATGTVTSDDTLTVGDGSDMAAVSEDTKLTTTGDVNIGSEASLAALSNAGNTLTVDGALTLTAATTAGGSVVADSLSLTGANTFETLTLTGAVTLDTASYTSVGLTAAGVTGNSLALVVDQATIVSAIGTSTTALTLANVTGLTSATINGESSFTDGSREYSVSVTDGLVQITASISNEMVWDATTEGSVWGDGSSWESGTQPTAESNVVFNGTGIADVTVSTGAVAQNVIVESETNFITTGTGEITTDGVEVNNGTLTIGENVTVTVAETTNVVKEGNIVIVGTLETGALAAADKDVLLSGTLEIAKEGVVNKIKGIDGTCGHLIVGSDLAPLSLELVENKLTIAEDSVVDALTVKSTGDLAAKGSLTVNEDAEVAEGGVMTVADDLTITGSLENNGDITVGSTSHTATLETGKVTNNGTITVYNTMTATDDVINNADATLTVSGGLTATTEGKTVTNNGELTVGGDAEVTALTTGADSVTEITGDATITGDLSNSGALTVNGALEADSLTTAAGATTEAKGGATISTALTNQGTTTITGALTATDAAVTNEATGEGEKLSVSGALAADSLTTAAGATTEAKGGATLGTSLTNHGTTTVTGNLVSADTTSSVPGSLVITNDATGEGEKLTVSGKVSGTSLTTETGATTEINGGVKLADDLVNDGTTTIKGALETADDVFNKGTLTVGGMKADKLDTTGDVRVKGDATLKALAVASTGKVQVDGKLTTDAIDGTAGTVQADKLDLSGLTAAATIANLKADTITLSGFDMLTVTESLSNEAGTGAAKVQLTLDEATMSTLSVGDKCVVVAVDPAATGYGVTLSNLASVNNALKAYGLKGAMVTDGDGQLVMLLEDNSFTTQLGSSANGMAGLEMADAALAAGVAPEGDLARILSHLDELRTAATAEAAAQGDKIGSALSGASVAAMGLALSGDVDRQLRAIRNRTTTMGVNQAVVNEGMPYLNAWVNAEGDYRDIASDGSMPGYKLSSWGGTVGFDVDCTPSFTCGLAATAMYGDFDAKGDDQATGDLNTYYVTAFGRYAKHRWTHTFVATAGLADTTLSRTVDGVNVKGSSEGSMFGGMYEVGYVFALDKEATTCLQPIVNVSYTHATLNGYDESGSDIALKTGDVELNKLTIGAGARVQSVLGENIYNRSSLFEARALVKFDAGDRQGEVTNAFANYAGSASVKSVETGAFGAEFGVGLTVPVGAEGGNLFMDASAEIRSEYVNVNGTVGYRVNF